MKRLLLLLPLLLLLSACVEDEPGEIEEKPKESAEVSEEKEVSSPPEKTEDINDIEKELYLSMLIQRLNEYESEYEGFEAESGIDFYHLVIDFYAMDESTADELIKGTIELVDEDMIKVYERLYDDILGLEEMFPDIDWSD